MRVVIYQYFTKASDFAAMCGNTPQVDGGSARGIVA